MRGGTLLGVYKLYGLCGIMDVVIRILEIIEKDIWTVLSCILNIRRNDDEYILYWWVTLRWEKYSS